MARESDFNWKAALGPHREELAKKRLPEGYVEARMEEVRTIEDFQRVFRELMEVVAIDPLTQSGEAMLGEGMKEMFPASE